MTGLGGPARPVRPMTPAPALPPSLTVFAMTGVLVAAGLIVAWMGQRAVGLASARPAVAWALDPASNTVTIRLRPGGGPSSRTVLARSHLTVSEDGNGKQWTQPPGGAPVGVAVPPGRRTRLVVQVAGPAPFSQALTVATPQALRVTASRRDSGGSASGYPVPSAGGRPSRCAARTRSASRRRGRWSWRTAQFPAGPG